MAATPAETEVFRISPKEGKHYYTAEWTRREGRWPSEKYFTTHPLKYVGEFVKHVQQGAGDGARHTSYFLLDGKEVLVHYQYEGTTSFVEKKQ